MIVDRCTAHADRESDAVRKTMLCTALRDEPEFFSLQHQDNIFQAQGNPPITYDNYLALLRSTAFNIDSTHTGKPRRQAHTAHQTSSSSSSHNKGGHGKGGGRLMAVRGELHLESNFSPERNLESTTSRCSTGYHH